MLHRVKARTLLLVGRDDWICSPIVSDPIQAGISGAKMVVFEHTGHFPWIEDPSEFFSAVTNFLTK
jgi:proline iminopeptidase